MLLKLVYQSDSFKESPSHGSGLPPSPLYPIFLLMESGWGLVTFSCLALPPCHQGGALAEVLTNGC